MVASRVSKKNEATVDETDTERFPDSSCESAESLLSAESRRLSVFLDGHFGIQAIPPTQRPLSIDIRCEAFLPYIKELHGLARNSEELRVVYNSMAQQLIRATTANGATLSADGSTLFFEPTDVHPEARVCANRIPSARSRILGPAQVFVPAGRLAGGAHAVGGAAARPSRCLW
ncbi:hypothetical protein PLICRDRAFT_47256 [Plicaturopsis crispa FD-325 SS-3]|uniref:Uncharacterized protein n=1 Tax=Plicaturopsis crispa FD-325 SS-3 TaxID=944288 RepID=A0A0C9T286_PLICR|nr:hypothetical protein PLICRDRAFT_47256 [Plicaturopsis crispa FD-325 SS-3]